MNRRSLMTAAPAAGLAAMMAGALAAGDADAACAISLEANSPDVVALQGLWAEWRAVKAKHNDREQDLSEEERDVLFERILMIEAEAAAVVPLTVQGYAFKILFIDDDGDLRDTEHQVSMVAEARKFAGVAA